MLRVEVNVAGTRRAGSRWSGLRSRSTSEIIMYVLPTMSMRFRVSMSPALICIPLRGCIIVSGALCLPEQGNGAGVPDAVELGQTNKRKQIRWLGSRSTLPPLTMTTFLAFLLRERQPGSHECEFYQVEALDRKPVKRLESVL